MKADLFAHILEATRKHNLEFRVYNQGDFFALQIRKPIDNQDKMLFNTKKYNYRTILNNMKGFKYQVNEMIRDIIKEDE